MDHTRLLKDLVPYGALAASSHNTQCWQFRVNDQSITILPDLSRRCPVVDPDDHHLYVSLGCAAENILHAARANGLVGQVQFDSAGAGAIHLTFAPCEPESTPLFEAIPHRQCSRTEYDGQPLTPEELQLLTAAGTGEGVRVVMLSGSAELKLVEDFVVLGNTAQLKNPAFVQELTAWIRFNKTEAERRGDGLYSAASGNPSLPRWLGQLVLPLVLQPRSENDKCVRQLRSSAGVAVFVSAPSDPAHWVEVGRAYERFALQATALGVRNAFLNQPVEEAALRPEFAKALGLGAERPDLVVRFGRGPAMPRSPRRPLEAVLV
ncbi:Acg family FMN-binding oxidoreductase [Leptolyngbya sp. KIOST-1]|uniref:Acg family FMN-binding oxidoreductase n=1 Tax=Leptolyngbya sp. KIOST-1 TaxID=1229172 RepID=UPI000567E823|nr:Tat pathway signal protein [Leptolyngbya sp. KIOST-1]